MSKVIKAWRVKDAPRNLYLPGRDIAAYHHVAQVGNEFGGLVIAGSIVPTASGWCYLDECGGMEEFDGMQGEWPQIFRRIPTALRMIRELNCLPSCIYYSLYIWVAPPEWGARPPFRVKVVGEVPALHK
jgi:hypothetical protein